MKYSLINIYNYIVGNVLYTLDEYGALPIYLLEQVLLREASCNCKDLPEAVCCGCTSPNVLYAPKGCSDNNFPPLMSYWKWKENRKQHDLSIIRYGYAKSTLPEDFPCHWIYYPWKGWECTVNIYGLSDEVIDAFTNYRFEEVAYLMRPIPESIENTKYSFPEVTLDIKDGCETNEKLSSYLDDVGAIHVHHEDKTEAIKNRFG